MRLSVIAAVVGFSMAGVSVATDAQAVIRRPTSIEAQELSSALQRLAEERDFQVVYSSDLVNVLKSSGAAGDLTFDEAITQILSGTGLTYRYLGDKAITIVPLAGSLGLGTQQGLRAGNWPAEAESNASPGLRFALQGAGSSATDSPAAPQTTDEAPLSEVLVRGSKRKFAPSDSTAATKIRMDVLDTPQAVTVLSSELIDIVGARGLPEVAALAPGVVNKESDFSIFNGTVSHGFETNYYEGFKINGMPNDAAALDFGIFDRVEVVRGPASVIYGQSDYGATVSAQLKAPQRKLAFAGELGGSIDGATRLLGDATGALTDSERLRGRLILVHDDYETSRDLAFQRTFTAAPSLSWDLSQNTTLDLTYVRQNRDTRYGRGFGLTTDMTLPDIPKDAFLGAAWARTYQNIDFALGKISHDFGNGWNLSLAGEHTQYYLYWGSTRVSGLIPPNGVAPLQENNFMQEDSDSAAEANLTGDFSAWGRSHTLLLSASYRKVNADFFNSTCVGTTIGSMDVNDPDPWAYNKACPNFPTDPGFLNSQVHTGIGSRTLDIRDAAVMGLLLLHPVDRLTAMLGLRYIDHKNTAVLYFDRSQDFIPDYASNDATYRAGLVYELARNVNAYASYATGIAYATSSSRQSSAGQSLPPETGVQYEAGVKAGLFDRRLIAGLSVFQIDRKNVTVPDPDFPGLPYAILINGQMHRGFELEALGEPVPGWNILANYSYLDINITKAANPLSVGQRPANSPKDMLKLYTTYQFQGGPLRGWSIGGGLFHVGKREVDSIGTFAMPAYTKLDLRLGYDALEHLSFSLNASNVTDEDIYVSVSPSARQGIDYAGLRTVMFRMNFSY